MRPLRVRGLLFLCGGMAACGSGVGATNAPTSVVASAPTAPTSSAPTTAATSASAATSAPTTAATSRAVVAGDPCSLLTQAEVTAALGVSVGPGSLLSGDPHQCTWIVSPTAGALDIGIIVGPGGLCTAPSKPADGFTSVPASGIGDGAACYTNTRNLFFNLYFAKGGQVYAIQKTGSGGAPEATIDAAMKTLALDAIARL